MDKATIAYPAISGTIPKGAAASTHTSDVVLKQKAKALEASFLAEMLGHAGLGAAPEAFGGGIGEQQFASLLRHEQAKALVEKGGIGLAQQIFESLKQRQADDTAP